MGQFEEQLLERSRLDQELLEASMSRLTSSLLQKRGSGAENDSADELFRIAVEQICRYYKVPLPDKNAVLPEKEEQLLDVLLRPSGLMRRWIALDGNWYKDGDGALLAFFRDSGKPLALIPDKSEGYRFIDPASGKIVAVNEKNTALFAREAICFYAPLPDEPLSGRQFIRCMLKHVEIHNYLLVIVAALVCTLTGVFTPLVTGMIYKRIVPSGEVYRVGIMAVFLICLAIGNYLASTVRSGILSRIRDHMDVYVQNAVTDRLLRLPVQFFQDKDSGTVAQSAMALNVIPEIFTGAVLGSVVNAAFALVYVIEIGLIAPVLFFPALVTLFAQLAVILLFLRRQTRQFGKELSARAETQDLVYALFNGIQRLRLSGSEQRAFAKWAQAYANVADIAYHPPFIMAVHAPLVSVVGLLGMLWAYAEGAAMGLSVSTFAAFISAFGMATGMLTALCDSAKMLGYLKPSLDLAGPILQTVPESTVDKRPAGVLCGNIALNRVSFRYGPDEPLIINDINLKIHAGDYVAIVGKTGCGKSTLIRLLLGFETPESGTIIYDDMNIDSVDPISLRRQIGTVLQNGSLFTGNIYENIVISAPWLTMADAWDAAETAGIAEDIRQMPMQMHTVITENSGISGGQKQRLLIARAVAPKPKILIFDEATSALDNITQKHISEALSGMKCTRIVIAHRLSTIRECDRIIALDGGRIVEDGTYDELMEKNGFFANLVRRQTL